MLTGAAQGECGFLWQGDSCHEARCTLHTTLMRMHGFVPFLEKSLFALSSPWLVSAPYFDMQAALTS